MDKLLFSIGELIATELDSVAEVTYTEKCMVVHMNDGTSYNLVLSEAE